MKQKPTESPNSPRLSVIIASIDAIEKLKSCLEALNKQSKDKNIEIIACAYCDENLLQDVKGLFPQVEFIHFLEKSTLPQLWGAGITRASGQIIAITDSTCIISENWISSILKAHESQHPVIGGAVETAELNKWVDWAAYFCEYGQFMYPLKQGVVNVLPGNNISFKRWALDEGREFVQDGFWKTYWCRKLQEKGYELISEPTILIYYNKTYDFIPFLIRRFRHGRCFGGMRNEQISLLKRSVYALGSPILPFIFLTRIIKVIISKKRFLIEFMFSFPITVLAIGMWALGELWGYVFGTGKSRAYIY
jgi:glycosyltransferase involved in cell wall biosynthesis